MNERRSLRVACRVSEPTVAARPPTGVGDSRRYGPVAVPVVTFALVSLTAGLLASGEPSARGYTSALWFFDPAGWAF